MHSEDSSHEHKHVQYYVQLHPLSAASTSQQSVAHSVSHTVYCTHQTHSSFGCADEIDAIGKARGTSASDSGTAEREQGLLQLLCEMDGFKRNDKVLVIGATNRLDSLDDALIRPGRFDRTIYMGRPTTSNRFKILQVCPHAIMLAFQEGSDRGYKLFPKSLQTGVNPSLEMHTSLHMCRLRHGFNPIRASPHHPLVHGCSNDWVFTCAAGTRCQ